MTLRRTKGKPAFSRRRGGSGIGVAVLPTPGGEENDEEEQNAETDAHQKPHASEENVIALGGIRGIVFAGFGGSV